MNSVSLKCHCGEVQGTASNITPSGVNRVVCCCSSCQAFADHLQCEKPTLDEFGGTEIIQMAQSQVTIHQGQDKLQSLRLTKKGLLRWHTSCCNTPIGNTLNAKMPFVGVIHSFIAEPDRHAVFGPVSAVVQTQYAKGEPGYPKHSAKFPLSVTAGIVGKMMLWKIKGMQKPSAFFSDDGRPVSKPVILDGETI